MLITPGSQRVKAMQRFDNDVTINITCIYRPTV